MRLTDPIGIKVPISGRNSTKGIIAPEVSTLIWRRDRTSFAIRDADRGQANKRKRSLLDTFDALMLFFMDSPGHVTGTIPSPVTKAMSLYWHSPSSP